MSLVKISCVGISIRLPGVNPGRLLVNLFSSYKSTITDENLVRWKYIDQMLITYKVYGKMQIKEKSHEFAPVDTKRDSPTDHGPSRSPFLLLLPLDVNILCI